MKIFNVADPTLDIHQPLLLEASAGTGKTFSIENIVVRALTEDPKQGSPLTIQDILIVTFTKAAAKELKTRIFQNLRKEATLPRIKRALVEFDLANISTIHAFCYRALRENATTFRLHKKPEELSLGILWRAVEKYFRIALTQEAFTPGELNTLLKAHRNDVSLLAQALIRVQGRGVQFDPPESHASLNSKFKEALAALGYSKEELLEAFNTYAYHFYGLCEGKSKVLKKNYKNILTSFEPSEELIELLSLKLKKSCPKPPLTLFDELEAKLLPLLNEMASYEALFARLASGYQQALYREFEAEETCDFSYLLVKMEALIREDPAFKKRLQAKYRMVIIDEFQDTDPLQWKIFNELFKESALILVGDPKQSIYAFRNADIYTYLNAASTIEAHYLLNTNYRSTPQLVTALNHLFAAAQGWMALPYLKTHLPYSPVKSPCQSETHDEILKVAEQVAVHFLFVEGRALEEIEGALFPRFLAEVYRLHEKGISFASMAFLVRDHFQSDRLFHYFQTRGLPALQKRSLSLENAKILPDLIHLLRALKAPKHFGLVQIALGTQFFRWTANDLDCLKDETLLNRIFFHFQTWHSLWEKEGIGFALETLLFTPFLGPSVQEILLSAPDGRNRYHELRQIIEWLVEREEDPLTLLEETLEQPLRPLVDLEAVQILTLHMSKGLEFEAVFALGVINRPPLDKGLIIARSKVLNPSNLQEYEAYLEENDAEKARQLYVALTRAKAHLYIPFIEGWKPPSLGSASPLELWLARIKAPLCPWKELYQRLQQSRASPLRALIEECPYIKIHRDQPFEVHLKPLEEIVPPFLLSIDYPFKINTSFSALAKTAHFILQAPSDFNAEMKTAHTLPAGTHTGDLLHQLLGEIPFSADVSRFVRPYIVSTPFEPWEEVIASMISKSLAFLEVAEEECFREMEFTYPLELAADVPACRSLRGMLKGVIDLFFIRSGKYYLLDWKSNWLGSEQSAYTEAAMHAAMCKHAYDLQAEIYKRAVRAYLAQVDPRPFNAIFGGVIYYFLRGHTYVIY